MSLPWHSKQHGVGLGWLQVDAIVQMDRASSSTPVNKVCTMRISPLLNSDSTVTVSAFLAIFAQECQTFHCRVLQNAVKRSAFSFRALIGCCFISSVSSFPEVACW